MIPTDVFKTFGGYFQQSTFWGDPIRSISEWFCWLMRALVNGAYELLNVVYSLSGFITSPAVIEFLNSWKPAFFVAFTLAIIMLGYYLLINPDKEKPPILKNILMAVLIITALPTIMILGTNAALSGANAVNGSISDGTTGNLSYADRIYVNSLTDLKYLSQNGWDTSLATKAQKNNVNYTAQLTNLDINERMWPDQMTSKEQVKEVFSKKPVVDDTGNITKTEDIKTSGMIWQLIPVYYRYNVDYFSLFVTLLATILALFFIAYKTARLLWELAVHQFFALFFATTDFVSGAKTKKVISSMINILITIFMTSILLRFFLLGSQYIQTLTINPMIKGFILLFWALACIDGPNILERILGIDAGLKSGWRTALGIYGAGRVVSNAGKRVGHAAAEAAGTVFGKSGSFRNAKSKFSTRNRNVGNYKAPAANTGGTDNGNESHQSTENTSQNRNVAHADTQTEQESTNTAKGTQESSESTSNTKTKQRNVGGYSTKQNPASPTNKTKSNSTPIHSNTAGTMKTERNTNHVKLGRFSETMTPMQVKNPASSTQAKTTTTYSRAAAKRSNQNNISKKTNNTTKRTKGGTGGIK